MLGRKFTRRQLECIAEDNFCAIDDILDRLTALETMLKVQWTGDEYKPAPAKRGRKPGSKNKTTKTKTTKKTTK